MKKWGGARAHCAPRFLRPCMQLLYMRELKYCMHRYDNDKCTGERTRVLNKAHDNRREKESKSRSKKEMRSEIE